MDLALAGGTYRLNGSCVSSILSCILSMCLQVECVQAATFLARQTGCLPDSQNACRAARMRVGQPECLSGSQNACQAARMPAGQPECLLGEHVQGGQNVGRAARMHAGQPNACQVARMLAGQPECLPAGQPECVLGSKNACRATRMRARPWQRPANGPLQGGENACRALAVACPWPGSGLAVAWQPGSGCAVACQWPGNGLAVDWQPGSGWSGKLAEVSSLLGAKG